MRPNFPLALAGLLVAGFLALIPTGPAVRADTDASTGAGLDARIRDYIMNNPQVIRDALLKLERDEEIARAKTILREHKADIYESGSPVIGNAEGKVTIVEFSDYNCPYCRAAYLQIKAFLKDNPDTKVVLKDVASLGKDSEDVARVVIAAAKQKDIAALHDALMTRKGKITEAIAIETAGKHGFDVARLKADAKLPETGAALTRTQDLATRLSVTSTPLYIIGHNGIAGAPDDLGAQLAAHVKTIRASGCDVC
jgi:protein-disulfide isomerase